MTVRQLASLLGLSKSTVAYALRGDPAISGKTREMVQRRARELGYQPNPVASAFLQQVRSQGSERYRANLAFLFKQGKSRFLQSLSEGIHERAWELGYGVDDIRAGTNDSAALTRQLLARGVIGVIIGPLTHAVGHLTLDWSRFACTAFGHSMARPLVNRTIHNYLQGICTAFRMCRRRGFRRIGLALSVDSDHRSNGQWTSGYLGIQHSLPASEKVPMLRLPLAQFHPDRISRWMIKEKPDVIIVHASGCIPDLAGLLAGPPRRIPAVVLDREPSDPHAGIDQRFKLCGRLLIDSISSQILHNQRGIPETPIVSMVDGLWVDHPSLFPTPKAAGRRPRKSAANLNA